MPSVKSLAERNRMTQPHWYNVVRTSVSTVSNGHFLRTATQASPMFKSSR